MWFSQTISQTGKVGMTKKTNTKLPSLFLAHGIYYFKLTVDNPKFSADCDQPKKIRMTFSTRESNYDEAYKYMKAFVTGGRAFKASQKIENLANIIHLFLDPKTNPKMQSAKIEGKSYSLRHAENVARDCRHLLEVLCKHMPFILKVKMTEITRKDSLDIREAIYIEYGNNYVAHEAFKKYKMAMMYAADIGLIPFSPAEKIDNIKPKEAEPIFVLSPEDIVTLYSTPELFASQDARAQFMVFATTGMRRSELGALTVEQIYRYKKAERVNGRLVFQEGWAISIDRAFKDKKWEEAGLPKWNKTRCIPIADMTYKVLEPYLLNKAPSDRVFDTMTHHTLIDDFKYLRDMCNEYGVTGLLSCPAAIENLTPHKLRHSLNTFLSTSDIKDILTNEYMSWAKQKKDNVQRMQSHYTHINVNHLASIANLINEMYNDNVSDNLIPFTVNG